MAALAIVLLILALLFGGLGLGLHILWWIAVIFFVLFIIGFFTGGGGYYRRW